MLCPTTQLIKLPEPALECEIALVKVMIQCLPAEFITTFITLSRLERTAAYCLRFTHSTRNPFSRKTSCLTSTELRDAMHTCLKVAQQEIHSQEVDDLCKKGLLRGSSFNLFTPSLTRKIVFELVEDCSIHIFHKMLNINL
jgi:hypothetical protein